MRAGPERINHAGEYTVMKLNELLSQHSVAKPDQPAVHAAQLPSGGRVQDLETVLSVVRKINTSLVLSDVLALVIDHAIRITQADRGFLMLADKDGKLQYVIAHDKQGNLIQPENFQVSRSVLEDVFSTGASVCIEDALNDERFEQRKSIVNLELQTIMCAPMQTHEQTIGVIYVDSRYIHAVNKDEVLRMFEILAGQAATAINNARLYGDLKKTFEELRDANDHIIKSERMALRGEMAAEVSHELKNILNIALLQTQALQRRLKQGETDTTEKLLSELVDSIRKIHNFSESLLVRERLSSELEPLQLNQFVGDFTMFIRHLPKFRKGKVQGDLDMELPLVLADRDQIQQVLLNLANNAIEAFDEATITIATTYDFATNTVRLAVTDNGPGLPPQVKAKAFLEKVTTKADGHGFGLPVCRKIIQNHKGDITVRSEEGKGTTFVITIPAAPPGFAL